MAKAPPAQEIRKSEVTHDEDGVPIRFLGLVSGVKTPGPMNVKVRGLTEFARGLMGLDGTRPPLRLMNWHRLGTCDVLS